jgi:hypothetical protein
MLNMPPRAQRRKAENSPLNNPRYPHADILMSFHYLFSMPYKSLPLFHVPIIPLSSIHVLGFISDLQGQKDTTNDRVLERQP